MNRTQFTAYRKNLLVKNLQYPRTANEAIDKIFLKDLKKGMHFVVTERGWKFYVHLNKFFAPLFAPLEREGKIKNVGVCGGEKIWVAT